MSWPFFLFKKKFYYLYVCVCVKGPERGVGFLKLELQTVVNCLIWMLGIELWSSCKEQYLLIIQFSTLILKLLPYRLPSFLWTYQAYIQLDFLSALTTPAQLSSLGQMSPHWQKLSLSTLLKIVITPFSPLSIPP